MRTYDTPTMAVPMIWRGTHYRSISSACKAHPGDDPARIKAAAFAQVRAAVESTPPGPSPGELADPDMGF